MFRSRDTNYQIIKLHERAFRLVQDDYTSTFKELLEKHKSLTFCIQLYKVHNNLCQTIFSDLFIILTVIYIHNRILLFPKLKLFTNAVALLNTLDLLSGI